MPDIEASESLGHPPTWATKQRAVFDLMGDALEPFVEDYFDDDGDLFWPPEDHVGIDGVDDVFEGFYNWPLVYALGGDEKFRDYAREKYEVAIDRFERTETPFGHTMLVDEYEQCRDWFHQGEGNLLLYNFGLADPHDETIRKRAERFAGFYFGDADVDNYDPDLNLVRAPQTGSMGPEYASLAAIGSDNTFGGYGSEYRWAGHGLPWRDLEFETATELLDPENEERLYEVLDQRCSKGDIPLNLGATSLMTNAYLHTGDDEYREWVTEYVEAWMDRTEENDGVVPDNVGRSGEIGEYTDGKWYGGFYGWSWGGWHYVGVGVTIGSENASLLTGDREYMSFLRSQLDVLMDNAIERSAGPLDSTLYLPHKYGDPGDYHYNGSGLREDDGEILHRDGWFEFKPHRDNPYAIHLWYMTMDEADRERVRDLRDWGSKDWKRVDPRASSKHGDGHEYPWLAYLDGEFPDYPERILDATSSHVQEQLRIIREEGGDIDDLNEDYLRDRNPVFAKALLQLTMGAPQPVYYGGLTMAQIRHFDRDERRAGLPRGVAALVEDVTPDGVSVTLVNAGGRDRELAMQAGAYGEHTFTAVDDGEGTFSPDDSSIRVSLPSGTRVSIDAELDRFSNDPSYAFPWE